MAKPGPVPGTKHTGRPKGSPNVSTLFLKKAIAAACGEDWDPVVAMATIAKKGTIPTLNPNTGLYEETPVNDKIRQTCLKEVAEYVHAKRRAVEVTGADGDPIEIVAHNDTKAEEALLAMRCALDVE